VEPEYLKKCLVEYRPPRVPDGVSRRARQHRPVEARVWFLAGLTYVDWNDAEASAIEEAEKQARKRTQEAHHTYVDSIRYTVKPKYYDYIREGDWVIQCLTLPGNRREVCPRARVLQKGVVQPAGLRKRYLLTLEEPEDGEIMTWSAFRKRVHATCPVLDRRQPRTVPLRDADMADAVLRVWTPPGRVAKT
jgi:hypothetical protein